MGLVAAGLAALLLAHSGGGKTEVWSFTMTFTESQAGFKMLVEWPKISLEVNRGTHTITLAGTAKPVGVVHASTGSCVDPPGPIQLEGGTFPYRISGKTTASGFTLDVHSAVVIHATSTVPICNNTVHETAEILDPTLRTFELPITVAAGATSAHFSAGPIIVDLRRVK